MAFFAYIKPFRLLISQQLVFKLNFLSNISLGIHKTIATIELASPLVLCYCCHKNYSSPSQSPSPLNRSMPLPFPTYYFAIEQFSFIFPARMHPIFVTGSFSLCVAFPWLQLAIWLLLASSKKSNSPSELKYVIFYKNSYLYLQFWPPSCNCISCRDFFRYFQKLTNFFYRWNPAEGPLFILIILQSVLAKKRTPVRSLRSRTLPLQTGLLAQYFAYSSLRSPSISMQLSDYQISQKPSLRRKGCSVGSNITRYSAPYLELRVWKCCSCLSSSRDLPISAYDSCFLGESFSNWLNSSNIKLLLLLISTHPKRSQVLIDQK